ncbi:MAG: DUF2029 domain-containing protein [Gemmataceae bacterium]|nr:DUF2029 domain-containing protein [Gemmataceae bacterium]
MSIAGWYAWFESRSRWEKAALLLWGAILLFVSVRVFLSPDSKTVYPIFSASGRFWWTGIDLYEPHRPTDVQDGYRYSPTFAILVTPFAMLPDSIGGIAWRLFNAGALFVALWWLLRTVLPTNGLPNVLAWLLLLTIPLTLQSVNNGQANLLVVACMLGTVAAVSQERWNLASALLAIAFLCKLYPLALGMVLILLYPRQLVWRIPLAAVASLAAPFLFQQPVYVADQYAKWIAVLRADDRASCVLENMYRDLWLLIHLYGLPISRTVYTFVQMLAGIGVAALCWHRQRAGWSESKLLTSTLALVTAWMMLLGPATESSSFVLLAPSFAWSVLEAWKANERNARHGLLWGSCAIFVIAVVVGGINKDWKLHEAGVHAWGSLCYFVYLLLEPTTPAAQQMQLAESRRLAA